MATANNMADVDSFSELLQLPVNEDVTPTQLSSSPVKPKRRATPIQAAHNELEKRSIIVYGVPQSKAEVAADRVRHDMKSLESYFKSAPLQGTPRCEPPLKELVGIFGEGCGKLE